MVLFISIVLLHLEYRMHSLKKGNMDPLKKVCSHIFSKHNIVNHVKSTFVCG